jgi:hypothetical protein
VSEAPTQIETRETRERELRRHAERLAQLRTHPGFMLLLNAMRLKEERMDTMLLARVKESGLDLASAQRQTDYDRGFVAGMGYAEQVVASAERKLREYDAGVAQEAGEEEDFWSNA